MTYNDILKNIYSKKIDITHLFVKLCKIENLDNLIYIYKEINKEFCGIEYNKYMPEKRTINSIINKIENILEKINTIGDLMLKLFNNILLIDDFDSKIRQIDIILYLNKIFYYTINNKKLFITDNNNDVLSAGILLYKYINNKLYILMLKSNNIYEDLGGKSEIYDKSIKDIAIRESYEESNGLLLINKKRLNNSIYLPDAKYVLYLIRATEEEEKIIDFGEYENGKSNKRYIEWVEYPKYYKLHYRLQTEVITDFLKKIILT